VLNPNEFSAPLADQGAFSSHAGKVGQRTAKSGFLGKAVGSVHKNLKYWKDTFETDAYVTSILEKGYRIPVKMSKAERTTAYRERNNQSACNKMPFVRSEVARLLADGQIVESKTPVLCTNPLSVAFKVNTDGSIKKRLVIDLSRWVNGFITPDKFCMARFQEALAQSSKGDYQSVFDISKAYHHLRLDPESYNLVGFWVPDEDGKGERYYHYVGQALGRVMRPLLAYLSLRGISNMMYVDDGRTSAATKKRADNECCYYPHFFSRPGLRWLWRSRTNWEKQPSEKSILDSS
jgi:hypothetical protein